MNNLGERFKSTLSLSKLLSNSHHCHFRTDTKHPAPLITQEENRFVCSVKIRWRLSDKGHILIRNLTTQIFGVHIYSHIWAFKRMLEGQEKRFTPILHLKYDPKASTCAASRQKEIWKCPALHKYLHPHLSLNICTFFSITTWNWHGLDWD